MGVDSRAVERANSEVVPGQVLPVLDVDGVRGIYGWEVNKLLSAAVDATAGSAIDTETIEANLRDFLNRIYYDLRNLGRRRLTEHSISPRPTPFRPRRCSRPR